MLPIGVCRLRRKSADVDFVHCVESQAIVPLAADAQPSAWHNRQAIQHPAQRGRRVKRRAFGYGASTATSRARFGNPTRACAPAGWPPWKWCLDDTSVSRRHAEARQTNGGGALRDLGSTNGTFLNGTRLAPRRMAAPAARHRPLRQRHARRRSSRTEAAAKRIDARPPSRTCWSRPPPDSLGRRPRRASPSIAIAARGPASSCWPCCGPAIISSTSKAKKTCCTRSSTTPWRRWTPSAAPSSWPTAPTARSSCGPWPPGSSRCRRGRPASARTWPSAPSAAANRSCAAASDEDPELAGARSIADGAMASVLCVLLRTPRKRLGVLHLDRGPLQKPFTKDDLHLADALAANVSAGIESAELLRKQRELFLNTITMLAQAVEMRDQYTGGHTARVTNYSLLLASSWTCRPESRPDSHRHAAARHRQDRHRRRHPAQAGQADAGRVRDHEDPHGQGRRDSRATVPDLAPVIPIVRSHHERWDGKGYPDGLHGREDSAAGPHRRRRRRLRRHDLGSALSHRLAPEVAFAEVEKQEGQAIRSRRRRRFPEHPSEDHPGRARPTPRSSTSSSRAAAAASVASRSAATDWQERFRSRSLTARAFVPRTD